MCTAQQIPGAPWDADNTQGPSDVFDQKAQVPKMAHRWREDGRTFGNYQLPFWISPVLLHHKKLLLNVDNQTV